MPVTMTQGYGLADLYIWCPHASSITAHRERRSVRYPIRRCCDHLCNRYCSPVSNYDHGLNFFLLDAEYMDRLMLKSATDRTLGVGIINGESELLVLTSATLMKAFINLDRVAQFNPQ